jgi:hypothetical protein
MAIPLLVSTDSTVEVVHTGDPCVDGPKRHDGVDHWILAKDAVCKRGADLVEVRPLNGEERWRAARTDDEVGLFYFWADMGVVKVNGSEADVKIWLRRLEHALLVQLATVVMSLTYGKPIVAEPGEDDPSGGTFPESD